MAKIKQIKMRLGIDAEHPRKETVVNVCYDATDRRTSNYNRPIPEDSKRFYIKLPPVVAVAIGETEVRAANQSDVIKVFEEALTKFKCQKTEVNRVIIFEFDVGPKPNARWNLEYGYSVRVSAVTYNETVMTACDGQQRYSYERIESDMNIGSVHVYNGNRETHQIPCDAKSEAFFRWVKINMGLLIEKLCELGEPSQLIKAIEAGKLLPLGTKEASDDC
jgi:hypothetical protein